MNDQHEHEPHEGDDDDGALTKDSEYYASKSGSRHGDGEGDGGHARRRLDELLSQRVPDDEPDAGETPPKDSPAEDAKAEPPSSGKVPPPSKKQPDKGAPDEG